MGFITREHKQKKEEQKETVTTSKLIK